jgi:hypothetical protein
MAKTDKTPEAIAFEENNAHHAAAIKAEAEVARLEAEAKNLEEEAEVARAKFERDPTVDSLTARDVLAQRAKNARQKATEYEVSTGSLRAENIRRMQRSELADLLPSLDWKDSCAGVQERVRQLYADFLRDLEKEMGVLVVALGERNDRAKRAAYLEDMLGDRSQGRSTPVSLQRATEHISAALAAEFGKGCLSGQHVDESPRGARLAKVGNDRHFFIAEVRFPMRERLNRSLDD